MNKQLIIRLAALRAVATANTKKMALVRAISHDPQGELAQLETTRRYLSSEIERISRRLEQAQVVRK
jgi:hypothetical protein